jgi:hypothetical protein
MEQAFLLAKAHEGGIDWGYVDQEAKKNGLTEYLKKLREMLSTGV